MKNLELFNSYEHMKNIRAHILNYWTMNYHSDVIVELLILELANDQRDS